MSPLSRRRLAATLTVVLAATAVFQAQSARPQTTPAQMVVLLFDLSASPEDRERSVAMAERAVMDAQLRFGLGFETGRVWRIATVGAAVEIVQDFTGDWNKIDRALSRVADAASTTTDPVKRTETVRRFCEELSGLPQSDSYFSGAPQLTARRAVGTVAGPPDSTRRALEYYFAGSAMSGADQRNVETGCRQPNLIYHAVSETTSLAMLGGRLTAMVFDTASLSRDDLRKALDRATSIVDALPSDHAVAIVMTGVAPRFVQDFTRSKSRVRAALAKVEVPESSPDAPTTVTSVRNLCGLMARGAADTQRFYMERGLGVGWSVAGMVLGTPTGQMVISLGTPQLHYFSTAVERGLLAGRDLYDVAATCTTGGLLFYTNDGPWISPVYAPSGTLAAFGLRQIGYDVGIGLKTAVRQQNCPVALTVNQSELDNGYVSASIRNESPKLVQRVTLGVVMQPNDDLLKVSRILIIPGPSTSLTPGQSFEMSTRIADPDVLALYSRQGTLAELGVVEVQFGDGTKWTYDLEARGKFEK